VKLKPYLEYKNSGVPWVDRVPSHWKCIRAKWLFRKMQRPVTKSDDIITCFRDGVVTLRKNRRTLGFTESLKEIGYQGIRKGDLVIHQMDVFAGAVGVSDSNGKGSPIYSICTPKIELNTYYYAKIIREMARSKFILSLSKGIRERSTDFRFGIFSRQILPFPSLYEQKAIAFFLIAKEKKIAQFIHKKRQMIQLLKEQIYMNALTGKSNVPLKDIRWVDCFPSHWKIEKAKWIFKEIKINNNSEKDLLAVTQDRGILPKKLCEQKYVSPLENLSVLKLVRNGDYVISLRSFQGGIEYSQYEGIVSPAYSVFSLRKEYDKFEFKQFYRYLFKTKRFIGLLNTIISGIRDGKNINFRDFSNLELPIPPVSELNDFVLLCQKYEKYSSRFNIEKELLKEYQTRLISDVVTGKIDVREIEVEDIPDEELIDEIATTEEPEVLEESSQEVSNAS
jgi:type I restriction enzyme, S subunit